MKHRTKSILIVGLVVVLIASGTAIGYFKKNNKSGGDNLYTEYKGYAPEGSYTYYLESHTDATDAGSEFTIGASENYTASDNVQRFDEYQGEKNVVLTPEDGYIEWNVQIPETGFYQMKVKYLTYEGNGLKVERTVKIDGELPYNEAEFLTFERTFKDIEANPAVDINGNDIRPSQEEQKIWQEKMLTDASGYYSEPLKFYLTAGEHKIQLYGEREPLMLSEITFCHAKEAPSYSDYAASHKQVKSENAQTEIFQAEDMYLKSEKSNYPINDRTSSYTQPQQANQILLNCMGGTRWQKVGSSVSWKISVEKTGCYKIAPRYKQDYISGIKAYRKLKINGEVPFKEAEQLEFSYANSWQCKALGNGKEDYLFYFETGKEYILEMEVTLGNMDNILRRTEAALNKLNEIYKEILMVTGATPDKYRDYSFEKIIPDTLEALSVQAKELTAIKEEFLSVNGAGGERVAQLTKMEYLTQRMVADSSEIAGKFSTFQDNLSALGTWITDMSSQPLCFDYIALVPEENEAPKAEGGFFKNLSFQSKLFASSFVVDYSSIGKLEETDENNSIKVWVFTGRDQMNTIRNLINADFTKNTGVSVELELVTSGTLLRAVAAGNAPDVALGEAINNPINLALRNAVYDLKSFDDYEEIAKRFSASAMVPYTYMGKVYALPETMHFNVMFYRKDILGELNLTVPNTWDQWDAVISELSKKNMQVGLPHDLNMFLTFMYQSGSELYRNDGESVNFDSKEAYSSFEKLTEYYTLYGFETDYNFVNRFRTGEMPLAIADYTIYNQLSLFAPEIQGNWGMALVPGTVREDGSVDRTNTFTGTATVLLKGTENPEASWEFMKWWCSTDIQASYCNEMETVINASAKQPTANIEALKQLPWVGRDLNTLIGAWDDLKGTPEVPGGYYVTRTYSFAFNRVINHSEDPSETLQRYIESINSELTRKRHEFGIKD